MTHGTTAATSSRISSKQKEGQRTERAENLHRHMSNDSYNYAAYNASVVVVFIVACIVWFIVYTLWSVSYFLIAEISWSRDLLSLDWVQLLVVVAVFFALDGYAWKLLAELS